MSGDTITSNTPYDDVFKTLLNDCSPLILPMLNEIFGEQYTGEEQIVFAPNEHFLNRQQGREEKRITDTSFTVAGSGKSYLLECQSTADDSMLIRIFEYAAQIALDQGELRGNQLTVTIPYSAILFLRSGKETPPSMQIRMETPGGAVSFEVAVMQLKNYSMEELFEKNLLFLIPFYSFLREDWLKACEEDPAKLEVLKGEFAAIALRLEQQAFEGKISVYTQKTLLEMSQKVLNHLAVKYEKVLKGAIAVMGGNILDYEAKKILNEGRAEGRKAGRAEGRTEGRAEGILLTLASLVRRNRLTLREAAEAGLSENDFLKQMQTVQV